MTQDNSKPSTSALLSTSLKSSKRLLEEVTEKKKRTFQAEAEITILRAIKSNEEEECVHAQQTGPDPISSRSNGRSNMMMRASIVSKLPPVIEGASSTKTFGLSESSLIINSPPPKLRDIAQRIRMIQKVSQRRSSQNRQRKTKLFANQHIDGSSRQSVCLLSTVGDSRIYESNAGSGDAKSLDGTKKLEDKLLHKSEARISKALYSNFLFSLSKFVIFVQGRNDAFVHAIKVICYIWIPMLGVAAIMYYIAGNPIGFLGASYSWWILFAIRHFITFMVAQVSQFVCIDVVVMETKLALMIFGKVITLIAMQVKGWPTVLLFWSISNFGILYGDKRIVHHWGYWQSMFEIFNESNPSGTVTSNPWYASCLLSCAVCSFLTMMKRVLVAVFLGRKKYATYGPRMEQIMMKVLLISEISLLAEEIEDAASFNLHPIHRGGLGAQGGSGLLFSRMQSKLKLEESRSKSGSSLKSVKQEDLHQMVSNQTESSNRSSKWKSSKSSIHAQRANSIDSTKKAEIEKLLEWEEPMTKPKLAWKDTSIRTILQFKETLHYMDTDHPLSVPFGLSDTQKHCIESSEGVFRRLMMRSPESDKLKFETLLIVALNDDGSLDRAKAKTLKRLFKPNRHGDISVLDFIKTCNEVYKRIKMFRARTLNSAQLDDAFEQLLNIVFYFLIIIVTLWIQGVDPFNVFLSMTGILVPLAFLVNDAGSEYFQGLLLILARRPYDIGDCISISEPTEDAKINGSQPWFVQGITLFTTTVRNGLSNEVATISNGALAKTRIINAARSPKAQVFVYLKFSIDIPYEKVKIFHTVIKEFVRDHPREWIQLCAFRALTVEADEGFIEYEVIAQHVESWQIIGQVLQSRAELSSFCLEVMKQMNMRYESSSRTPLDDRVQQEETTDQCNMSIHEEAPMVDDDEYDDNLLEEDDGTMTEIERSNDEAILTAKSFNENTE